MKFKIVKTVNNSVKWMDVVLHSFALLLITTTKMMMMTMMIMVGLNEEADHNHDDSHDEYDSEDHDEGNDR